MATLKTDFSRTLVFHIDRPTRKVNYIDINDLATGWTTMTSAFEHQISQPRVFNIMDEELYVFGEEDGVGHFLQKLDLNQMKFVLTSSDAYNFMYKLDGTQSLMITRNRLRCS